MSRCYPGTIEIPTPYPQEVQRWYPTTANPYPMSFAGSPSPTNQVYVYYNDSTFLQGLNPVAGPIMFPAVVKERPLCDFDKSKAVQVMINGVPYTEVKTRNEKVVLAYPMHHSIPGPFQQSFINLKSGIRTYMY